jgi:two-component system, OmpR family, sensor histidine kinase KdpD
LIIRKSSSLKIIGKSTGAMFSNWWAYLWGPALIVLATLLGYLENNIFSNTNMMLFYLLCVVLTAIYGGLGPAILTSILSIVAQDYFFLAPYMNMGPPSFQDLLSLVVLLIVSILTSFLAARLRHITEESKLGELEASTLYALSRDLSVFTELDPCINTLIKRARDTFGFDVIFFLPGSEDKAKFKIYQDVSNFPIDENEIQAVGWALQHSQEAGLATEFFSASRARYFPLTTARGAIGVMGLWGHVSTSLTSQQEKLFKAFSDFSAVTIESIYLAEQARHLDILKNSEKLQTALLNSISHDLRTPLASVIGVLSSLQEAGIGLNESDRINLLRVAREEAERLNHLIGNLLDISRLEGGTVILSKQSSDIADLIGVALEQLHDRAANHQIEINIPTILPFVSVDFNLIVQALVNVLDNAIKYSPPGSIIDITGAQMGESVEIDIADRGTGIPVQDLNRIFNKFYRVGRSSKVPGTGLGLAICRGFVEAHGGRVIAENRMGGGTIVRMTLPVSRPTPSIPDEVANGR